MDSQEIFDLVRSNTPHGYRLFYAMAHNMPCPDHVFDWVSQIYKAREEGKPTVLEAHRGSTKTTAITQTLAAYRIGCEPIGSSLLVQLGDDIANDNSSLIANMIEHNEGFKACFPNVVPDKQRGYGASGYNVMRNDVEYNEWSRMRSKQKDPTFIGLGYKSRAVIGKHPSRDMFIDDIHDENNTASAREMKGVFTRVSANLEPTIIKNDPLHVVIGTPWVENDLLAMYKSLDEFHSISSPLYTVSPEGDGVYDDDIGEWIKILWPDAFSLKKIQRMRRMGGKKDGGIEFARMYLLDLTAASNRVFSYMPYPSTEIDWKWPMVGGVDYAGTADEYTNKNGNNDYFALAYTAKLPGGGAVVVDGVRARCTQGEAEEHVMSIQGMLPNYSGAVVEGDGKGEDFYQVLYRRPGIKLLPMGKTRGKGKSARLEKEMGPWLRMGRVRISDAETPFLNALRHELNSYPNNKNDDCMDAVYWSLRGMPDMLVIQPDPNELPRTNKRAEPKVNPLVELGRC
ncbi:MAG: hypothetical protein DRJ03_22860 [Chloroflexi bacterium]|nr:MAG: hypothetical protein DRJ03_22860 [Chloroflexota bacterium]